MFFSIMIAFVITLCAYYYYGFYYYYSYLKNIPSVTLWPLLNNVFKQSKRISILNSIQSNMKKLNTKSLRIHFPTRTLVITQDYQVIKAVLESEEHINKGYEYKFFSKWAGVNLLNATGEVWRSKRKMMAPAFHFQMLEHFQDVFNTNSAIMVSKLRKHVGDPTFNIYPFVNNCSLDIICETAMGVSSNAQSNETQSLYCSAIYRMFQIIPIRATNLFYQSEFIFRMTSLYKEEKKLLKIIHDYQNNIIRARRKTFFEGQQNSNKADVNDVGSKKKIQLLDLLFEATINGQPLSDEDISNEVSTIMVAGHDSSASATSFALYLLATHPEIQQRAVDELREIFGNDKERPASMADIQAMHYLELIIKETLRLYPAGPFFTRQINKKFTVDGITYPAGISVNIFAYGIQRDEDIYENPNTFDPERFSTERYDCSKPYAYLAFSAGPRNCIGQKYSIMELKTMLSSILRNFVLKPATPSHEPRITATIILRSANGIRVAIEKR